MTSLSLFYNLVIYSQNTHNEHCIASALIHLSDVTCINSGVVLILYQHTHTLEIFWIPGAPFTNMV